MKPKHRPHAKDAAYFADPAGDRVVEVIPTLAHRKRTYAITTRGVERDGEVLTRAQLITSPAPVRSWLREHGWLPRASGRSLSESERGTVKVQLRLAADVADRLRAAPGGASAEVTRLVRAAT